MISKLGEVKSARLKTLDEVSFVDADNLRFVRIADAKLGLETRQKPTDCIKGIQELMQQRACVREFRVWLNFSLIVNGKHVLCFISIRNVREVTMGTLHGIRRLRSCSITRLEGVVIHSV